jgi:hypothetical protein
MSQTLLSERLLALPNRGSIDVLDLSEGIIANIQDLVFTFETIQSKQCVIGWLKLVLFYFISLN